MDSSKAIAVVLAATVMLSVPPATSASVRGGHGPDTRSEKKCWRFKDTERGFARKINAARILESVNKLSLDRQLSKAARVHTWAMARQERLYHTPSDTLRHRITNWTILGENVGVGGNVQTLHKAFMDSPAHRDNILYPTFRYVGVGVLKKDGRMWVTVIFEAGKDPETTLPIPTCASSHSDVETPTSVGSPKRPVGHRAGPVA